jgi:hypothetical protein
MSKNAMDHVVLTDDDGSGTTGTILNNAVADQIQDEVDEALQQIVQTKSGNYTALVTDDVVICTAALTLDLYAVSGNSGRAIEVVNTHGSADVTIDGNSGETVDGAATYTLKAGTRIRLRCDGSNWISTSRDDLHYGTWTPLLGGSGGQSGQAYAVQVGRYVRTGRFVTAQFYLQMSTLGTITGTAQITGLPYNTENVTNQKVTTSGLYWTNLTNGFGHVVGMADANGAAINLYGSPTGAPTGMAGLVQGDLANTSVLAGTISYVANS